MIKLKAKFLLQIDRLSQTELAAFFFFWFIIYLSLLVMSSMGP